MQLSRRSFIASLAGALAVPRLALPAPTRGMVETVAPEVIAFRHVTDSSSGIWVSHRVVLFGASAKAVLERDRSLWSAVMVDRKVA
jgi:hypothetical protein